jgi:hypothetical protein
LIASLTEIGSTDFPLVIREKSMDQRDEWAGLWKKSRVICDLLARDANRFGFSTTQQIIAASASCANGGAGVVSCSSSISQKVSGCGFLL